MFQPIASTYAVPLIKPAFVMTLTVHPVDGIPFSSMVAHRTYSAGEVARMILDTNEDDYWIGQNITTDSLTVKVNWATADRPDRTLITWAFEPVSVEWGTLDQTIALLAAIEIGTGVDVSRSHV